MVDEEMPPENVECLEKAEKHYINVINYNYLVTTCSTLKCTSVWNMVQVYYKW